MNGDRFDNVVGKTCYSDHEHRCCQYSLVVLNPEHFFKPVRIISSAGSHWWHLLLMLARLAILMKWKEKLPKILLVMRFFEMWHCVTKSSFFPSHDGHIWFMLMSFSATENQNNQVNKQKSLISASRIFSALNATSLVTMRGVCFLFLHFSSVPHFHGLCYANSLSLMSASRCW